MCQIVVVGMWENDIYQYNAEMKGASIVRQISESREIIFSLYTYILTYIIMN